TGPERQRRGYLKERAARDARTRARLKAADVDQGTAHDRVSEWLADGKLLQHVGERGFEVPHHALLRRRGVVAGERREDGAMLSVPDGEPLGVAADERADHLHLPRKADDFVLQSHVGGRFTDSLM